MKVIIQGDALTDADISNTSTIKTRHLILTPIDGGCNISMFNGGSDSSILKIVESEQEEGCIRRVFWSLTRKIFVVVDDLYRWRDEKTFLREILSCVDDIILTIIKANGNVYLVTGSSCYCKGFDFSIEKGPISDATVYVDKFEPGFSQSPIVLKKSKWLTVTSQMNVLDNAFDLEKQVDLLSNIVLSLVDNAATGNYQKPAWLEDFRNMVNTYTSLKFQPEEQSITDVSNTKNKIRTAQQDYFNAIGQK
jgi:hypothetical protein